VPPRSIVPLLSLALALGACGSSAASPAPPADEALEIGWSGVPRDPLPAVREASAAALRLEGEAALGDEARRVHEGARAAFERVLERDPDELEARFRLACLHARLGDAAAALAALRTLLARDLPSFAPRLETEPALAALAAGPAWSALTAHRRDLEARWDDALARGVPVVWAAPRQELPPPDEELDPRVRRVMQAGVWLAREGRFVPMGPRLVVEVPLPREELALAATVLDPARRAVLLVEGEGSWSDAGPLGAVAFAVLDAGRGTERARFVSGVAGPRFVPPVRLSATEAGGALSFFEDTAAGPVPRALGVAPASAPALVVERTRAAVALPTWAPGGLALDGDVVRLGAGPAEAPLPPEQRAEGAPRLLRWAPRDEFSAWLLTAALEPDGWGASRLRAPALSVVGVASGRLAVRSVLRAPEGPAALLIHGPGAYAQLGERLYRLAPSADPIPLPAGLHLVSGEAAPE